MKTKTNLIGKFLSDVFDGGATMMDSGTTFWIGNGGTNIGGFAIGTKAPAAA